jgi:hypothetical protein
VWFREGTRDTCSAFCARPAVNFVFKSNRRSARELERGVEVGRLCSQADLQSGALEELRELGFRVMNGMPHQVGSISQERRQIGFIPAALGHFW